MQEIKWHAIRDESDFPPKLHKTYLISVNDKDCDPYVTMDSLTTEGGIVRWGETISEDVTAWAEVPNWLHYGDDTSGLVPYCKPAPKSLLEECKVEPTGIYDSIHWHLCDRFAPETWPKEDGDYLIAVRHNITGELLFSIDCYAPEIGWDVGLEMFSVVAWAETPSLTELSKTIFRRVKEDA